MVAGTGEALPGRSVLRKTRMARPNNLCVVSERRDPVSAAEARSTAVGSGMDPVRALQHALYRSAKADPGRRFHALRDKVYRRDVLWRVGSRCVAMRARRASIGPPWPMSRSTPLNDSWAGRRRSKDPAGSQTGSVVDPSRDAATPFASPGGAAVGPWRCLGGMEVSYGRLFDAATHPRLSISTKRLRALGRTPAGSRSGSCPDC